MELRAEGRLSMLMVSADLVVLSTKDATCKGWTPPGVLGCWWPCLRRFLYLPVHMRPRVPLGESRPLKERRPGHEEWSRGQGSLPTAQKVMSQSNCVFFKWISEGGHGHATRWCISCRLQPDLLMVRVSPVTPYDLRLRRFEG